LEILSVFEGMQTDRSDEQCRNADSSRAESRQPGSNIKVESFLQNAKQDFEMTSIDEGIQIDSSDIQAKNANSPRVEILQPVSKRIDKRQLHPEKHPVEIVSISLEIVTSSSVPRYRTRQTSPNETRKSPKTRKQQFPASTTIFLISDRIIAKPLI
jgi:hypothetical protein